MDTRPENGEAERSGFDSQMLRQVMENELAVARAPFAKRMDPARGCGSIPPFSAEENDGQLI